MCPQSITSLPLDKKWGLEQSFWSKVDRSAGPDLCWNWTASTVRGYGRIGLRNNMKWLAHRVAYEFTYGPIPAGLKVCHHCDNPGCVNPKHLFLGSQADNMRDATLKGRIATGRRNGRYTKPERTVRGERIHTAKLTVRDVGMIRKLLDKGLAYRAIARQFSVDHKAIRNIALGHSWRHVI